MDNETSLTALVGKAVRIAASAHENQRDKAGEAYILHPLRMMARAKTDAERIVAMLHDVVEDSPWTLEQLTESGFPPEITDAVDGLTRRETETYEEFINRAAKNPLATCVKLLDLEDNMSMTRLGALTDADIDRLKRYHAAYQYMKSIAEGNEKAL